MHAQVATPEMLPQLLETDASRMPNPNVMRSAMEKPDWKSTAWKWAKRLAILGILGLVAFKTGALSKGIDLAQMAAEKVGAWWTGAETYKLGAGSQAFLDHARSWVNPDAAKTVLSGADTTLDALPDTV